MDVRLGSEGQVLQWVQTRGTRLHSGELLTGAAHNHRSTQNLRYCSVATLPAPSAASLHGAQGLDSLHGLRTGTMLRQGTLAAANSPRRKRRTQDWPFPGALH